MIFWATAMLLMKYVLLSIMLHLTWCQQHNHTLPIRLPSITLPHNNSICLLLNISSQRELVKKTLASYYSSDGPLCSCGGKEWTRVVYLNMSDLNQQCPSNWMLTTSPIRGCGRRSSRQNMCDSVTYSVHGQIYSAVCGRILAYQKGGSYAFSNALTSNLNTIEVSYLSGVSLTHGPAGSRQHIWSFAGAFYESHPNYHKQSNCPCTNTNTSWPYEVPSFIDNNYFCDIGNPGPEVTNTYFNDNPLWDGRGCGITSTCCVFNSPPYFCTSLPEATSEDLEIRNCFHDYSSHEDRIISLIDIYVK